MRLLNVRSDREASMAKINSAKVDRRKFLAGMAVGAASAASVVPDAARAATGATALEPAKAQLPSALPPTTRMVAVETGTVKESTAPIPGRPGSDFMLDVIKSLKIEYFYSNPAS